jgi:hypothetical protein
VGQTLVCSAVLTDSSGTSQTVTDRATWSSSSPSVATVGPIGNITGKTAGQTTISAAYQSATASTQTSVQLQDAVEIDSIGEQGSFAVGTTNTVSAEGFYSVASVPVGQLSLVITDQTGAVIGSSDPIGAPLGGQTFLLSVTFAIPQGVTKVCHTATLQLGSTTLTSSASGTLQPCIAVSH